MTRPLLALHAAFAAGQAWQPLFRMLDGVEGLTPDLPGHGRAAPFDPSTDYMQAALDAILAVLPDTPVDVLGHSYGGALGLRLAVEHPERVNRLLVIEPVLFAAASKDVRDHRLTEMTPFFAALDAGKRDTAARIFNGIWGDPSDWDAVPDRIRSYITRRVDLIRLMEPGLLGDIHGIIPRLSQVSAPVTLVLRQDNPPEVVTSILDGLQTRLPNTRSAQFGTSHLSALSDPKGLVALLRHVWD